MPRGAPSRGEVRPAATTDSEQRSMPRGMRAQQRQHRSRQAGSAGRSLTARRPSAAGLESPLLSAPGACSNHACGVVNGGSSSTAHSRQQACLHVCIHALMCFFLPAGWCFCLPVCASIWLAVCVRARARAHRPPRLNSIAIVWRVPSGQGVSVVVTNTCCRTYPCMVAAAVVVSGRTAQKQRKQAKLRRG